MRTVAVILGDNDFGSTFRPLLESIHRSLLWHGALSRDSVIRLIHAGLGFHYLAFQVGGSHDDQDADRTVEYLGRIRVLFDEEAEADIQQGDHDGGAWYLEIATGNVFSY